MLKYTEKYRQYFIDLFEIKYNWYIKEYKEDFNNIKLKIRTYSDNDLSFDILNKISRDLGTKNINFTSYQGDDGYCNTCSDPYTGVNLTISNITKNPDL